MGELSTLAKQSLENVFMGKILAFEEANVKHAYSKQTQLDTLHSEIELFVASQPRSTFLIQLPDIENEDVVTLAISNDRPDRLRYEYIVTINDTWTGFEVGQKTINGDDTVIVKVFVI